MRDVYFSWKPKRPVLAWCGLLLILGILYLLLSAVIPEGGFSWKAWGFETHSFTVAGEEIDMRLDTSGFGRYAVELEEEEGIIRVTRDGSPILEGYFISAGECSDWMAEVLAAPDCQVIESEPGDAPASMLYRYETEEETGYVLLSLIDGSELGAGFDVLDCGTEEAALDCAHRLQFTRK